MLLASSVVMVEPRDFGFNSDTAVDNAFQHHSDLSKAGTTKAALTEFWGMVETLDKHHVEVVTLDSPKNVEVPDAVFPNNWFSSSTDALIVYPMKAPNRQLEVQTEELAQVLESKGFVIKEIHDLTDPDKTGGILEGTGVLIIDHRNHEIYANISERCELEALNWFGNTFDYDIWPMYATTSVTVPVYHTNVLMACGTNFAVIAEPCLINSPVNVQAMDRLRSTKQDVITISEEQMVESFCGNILQLQNSRNQPVIAMSESARKGFTAGQIKQLEKHGIIIPCAIDTIEYVGGGSARCMLAEIFLQKA